MKKLRFYAANAVILVLMLSFIAPLAQASDERSPQIIFAGEASAVQEETILEPEPADEPAVLPSAATDPLLVEFAEQNGGKVDEEWYSAVEGFFTMSSIFEPAASSSPAQEDTEEESDDAPDETQTSSIRSLFRDDTTFVSLRDFVSWHCPDADFSFNGRKASVSFDDRYMEFPIGKIYYYIDGRVLPLDNPCFVEDETVYVPIRAMATVFSYDVDWSSEAFAATLSDNGQVLVSGEEFYNERDYTLLAKLIKAESGNQPLEGKIAVGNVVMNRVRNSSFPNTIEEVIYDKRSGVQFTTAYNGSLNQTPNEECFIAAKLCLEGYSVTDSSLFFFNPGSGGSWIKNNRNYVTRIGDHVFYS